MQLCIPTFSLICVATVCLHVLHCSCIHIAEFAYVMYFLIFRHEQLSNKKYESDNEVIETDFGNTWVLDSDDERAHSQREFM